MLRGFFALLTIILLASGASAEQIEDVFFDEPLPIASYEAHKLFNQCSRSAPDPEGDVWVPPKPEIAKLEARLTKQFFKFRPATNDPQDSDIRYRGQYVGFDRDGVEYIYAAYVPDFDDYYTRSYFFDLDLIPFIRHNPDWFTWLREDRAVLGCDGGSYYWGIVYNPATEEFSEYEHNGW